MEAYETFQMFIECYSLKRLAEVESFLMENYTEILKMYCV
jgi:hypothetical protein